MCSIALNPLRKISTTSGISVKIGASEGGVTMGHIQVSRLIPAPKESVFQHISNLENLPFWLRPEIEIEWIAAPEEKIPEVRERAEIEFFLARFNLAMKVVVRIDQVKANECLQYRQVSGIYRSFQHLQKLSRHDDQSTLLTDVVDFEMPLGFLGAIADDLWIKKDLEKILNTRLDRIEKFFSRPSSELTESNVSGEGLDLL